MKFGWRVLAASLCALVSVELTLVPSAQAATVPIAPGCTAALPTALGGAIYGYPDNRSLGALVGMDLLDAKGKKIAADGGVAKGAYSYTDWVNADTLDGSGTEAIDGYERDWGVDEGSGQLCVSSKVRTAYFEVYPKSRVLRPDGTMAHNHYGNSVHITDTIRYGLATLQAQRVTVGAVNIWTLRLPLTSAHTDAHNVPGNTGDISGRVTYKGKKIDVGPNHANLRINTWANYSSSGCGIHGYATNVRDQDLVTEDAGVIFWQRYLAGGQCGAKTQIYKVVVDCYNVCGKPQAEIKQLVNVTGGQIATAYFRFT